MVRRPSHAWLVHQRGKYRGQPVGIELVESAGKQRLAEFQIMLAVNTAQQQAFFGQGHVDTAVAVIMPLQIAELGKDVADTVELTCHRAGDASHNDTSPD